MDGLVSGFGFQDKAFRPFLTPVEDPTLGRGTLNPAAAGKPLDIFKTSDMALFKAYSCLEQIHRDIPYPMIYTMIYI